MADFDKVTHVRGEPWDEHAVNDLEDRTENAINAKVDADAVPVNVAALRAINDEARELA